MPDNYKLPGSSYEEFIKIIQAYAASKPGQAMSLESVAQSASMDKTIISRNNGFLVQCGIITEGNQKALTDLGIKLARAYKLRMESEITQIWRGIIETDEFLLRMLSAIRIRNAMEKSAFVNHIVYSSGGSTGKGSRTGAISLVELLKLSGFVGEQDGQILAIEEPDQDRTILIDSKSITKETAPSVLIEADKNVNSTSIVVNININVDSGELDSLSPKILMLVNKLKG